MKLFFLGASLAIAQECQDVGSQVFKQSLKLKKKTVVLGFWILIECIKIKTEVYFGKNTCNNIILINKIWFLFNLQNKHFALSFLTFFQPVECDPDCAKGGLGNNYIGKHVIDYNL